MRRTDSEIHEESEESMQRLGDWAARLEAASADLLRVVEEIRRDAAAQGEGGDGHG